MLFSEQDKCLKAYRPIEQNQNTVNACENIYSNDNAIRLSEDNSHDGSLVNNNESYSNNNNNIVSGTDVNRLRLLESLVELLHLHPVLATSYANLCNSLCSNSIRTPTLCNLMHPTVFHQMVLSETLIDFNDIVVDGRSSIGYSNVLGTAKVLWQKYKEEFITLQSTREEEEEEEEEEGNVTNNSWQSTIAGTEKNLFVNEEKLLMYLLQHKIIPPYMTPNALFEKRMLLYLYVLHFMLANHHTLHFYHESHNKLTHEHMKNSKISKMEQNLVCATCNNEMTKVKTRESSKTDNVSSDMAEFKNNNNKYSEHCTSDSSHHRFVSNEHEEEEEWEEYIQQFCERQDRHSVCVEIGLIIASSLSDAEQMANEVHTLCTLCHIDVKVVCESLPPHIVSVDKYQEEEQEEEHKLHCEESLEQEHEEQMQEEVYKQNYEEQQQEENLQLSDEVRNVWCRSTKTRNLEQNCKLEAEATHMNSKSNVSYTTFDNVHFKRLTLCITTLDELLRCNLTKFVRQKAMLTSHEFYDLFFSYPEQSENSNKTSVGIDTSTAAKSHALFRLLTSVNPENKHLHIPVHLAAIATTDVLSLSHQHEKEADNSCENLNEGNMKKKSKNKETTSHSNSMELVQAKLQFVLHKIVNLTTRSFHTLEHAQQKSTNKIDRDVSNITQSSDNSFIDSNKIDVQIMKESNSNNDSSKLEEEQKQEQQQEEEEWEKEREVEQEEVKLQYERNEDKELKESSTTNINELTFTTTTTTLTKINKECTQCKRDCRTLLHATVKKWLDCNSTELSTYPSSFHLVPHLCLLINAPIKLLSPALRCELSRNNRRYYPLRYDVALRESLQLLSTSKAASASTNTHITNKTSWEDSKNVTKAVNLLTREQMKEESLLSSTTSSSLSSSPWLHSPYTELSTLSCQAYCNVSCKQSVRPLYLLCLNENDKLDQILTLLEEKNVSAQHLYKKVLIFTHQREVQSLSYRLGKHLRVLVFYDNNDDDDNKDADKEMYETRSSSLMNNSASTKAKKETTRTTTKAKAKANNQKEENVMEEPKLLCKFGKEDHNLIKRLVKPRIFHLHRSELLERIRTLQSSFYNANEKTAQILCLENNDSCDNNMKNESGRNTVNESNVEECVMLTSTPVPNTQIERTYTNREGKTKNEANMSLSSKLHTSLMSVLVSWNGCTSFDMMDVDCVIFHTPTGQALNEETWKALIHILHSTPDGELDIEMQLREELCKNGEVPRCNVETEDTINNISYEWCSRCLLSSNKSSKDVNDSRSDGGSSKLLKDWYLTRKEQETLIAYYMTFLSYNVWCKATLCENIEGTNSVTKNDDNNFNKSKFDSHINNLNKSTLQSIIEVTKWVERRRAPLNLVFQSSIDELRSVNYFMSLYYSSKETSLPYVLNIAPSHPLFTSLVHNPNIAKHADTDEYMDHNNNNDNKHHYIADHCVNKNTNSNKSSSSKEKEDDNKENSNANKQRKHEIKFSVHQADENSDDEQLLSLADVIKIKLAKQVNSSKITNSKSINDNVASTKQVAVADTFTTLKTTEKNKLAYYLESMSPNAEIKNNVKISRVNTSNSVIEKLLNFNKLRQPVMVKETLPNAAVISSSIKSNCNVNIASKLAEAVLQMRTSNENDHMHNIYKVGDPSEKVELTVKTLYNVSAVDEEQRDESRREDDNITRSYENSMTSYNSCNAHIVSYYGNKCEEESDSQKSNNDVRESNYKYLKEHKRNNRNWRNESKGHNYKHWNCIERLNIKDENEEESKTFRNEKNLKIYENNAPSNKSYHLDHHRNHQFKNTRNMPNQRYESDVIEQDDNDTSTRKSRGNRSKNNNHNSNNQSNARNINKEKNNWWETNLDDEWQ